MLVSALTDQKMPPKFVVVVPDDDTLTIVEDPHEDLEVITEAMKHVMNWLMQQYTRIIESYNEYIPSKAKRIPFFIWIEAPLHVNFKNNEWRKCFNEALRSTSALHENNAVLELKKIWDPDNTSLYLLREARFTSDGLRFYWEAVDKTVKFADTILMKKLASKKDKQKNSGQSQVTSKQSYQKHDKYHWYKPSSFSSRHRDHCRSERDRGRDHSSSYDQRRHRHHHKSNWKNHSRD